MSSAPQTRKIQLQAPRELIHAFAHGAGGDLVSLLEGLKNGRFDGIRRLGEQGGVNPYFEGLLVAGKPDTDLAIGALALQLHSLQFFLQFLGVLLDLLGLAESLGELTEIGESEAGHEDGERELNLQADALEAEAFDLGVKQDSVGLKHLILHLADQGVDVGRRGSAGVDDEVGMQG